MGWWIALGIIVLLMILPIGVSILYDADGLVIRAAVWLLRIKVFPLKKKDKKPKKEKKKKEKKPREQSAEDGAEAKTGKKKDKKEEAAAADKPTEKKGGSILDFLPLIPIALDMVGCLFGRTLHVDVLYLNLVMAGDDPCDLAMNYGKAWAALGNLWPQLERMLTIKKRDVKLQCDFESGETLVTARVDITITLGRLLGMLIVYGCKLAVTFIKILWQRKKAAKTTM